MICTDSLQDEQQPIPAAKESLAAMHARVAWRRGRAECAIHSTPHQFSDSIQGPPGHISSRIWFDQKSIARG
jgi:hypothetical protein